MKRAMMLIAAGVTGCCLAGTYLAGEGDIAVRGWQTTGRKSFREIETTPFSVHRYLDKEPLDVDAAKPLHEFMGLGASMTDASAWLLSRLPAERRRDLLRHVFTPEGANLSLLRLNIGASDYSTALYTYDDTPGDVAMKDFSVTRDDNWIFPMVRESLTHQPDLRLIASPWSMPGWMKDTGEFVLGKLKPGMEEAAANYLCAYAVACAERKLPLWALNVQNEVGLATWGCYPSCTYTPQQEAAVARLLRRKLDAAGLGTKVWIWDWDYFGATNRVMAQLADSATRKAVGGVAFHSYGRDESCLRELRRRYADMPFYHTEHGPALGNVERNEAWWCGKIFRAIENGCSTYVGWNLCLDDEGGPLTGPHVCAGLLTVDRDAATWVDSAQFTVFRHVGPFVKRGARVMQVDGFRDGAQTILFRNPGGEYVLIIGSNGTSENPHLPRPRLRILFRGRHMAIPLPRGTWSVTTVVFGGEHGPDEGTDCAARETVKGEEASLLPKGRTFRLVWNDEFSGEGLDQAKWSYRTNFWGRRFMAYAAPEEGAVAVKDGAVHLRLIRRADGSYASPQLQTGGLMWDIPTDEGRKEFWPLPRREKPKFEHRYGYYECRCRLQQEKGWWSAFWMQSEMQGCSLDPGRSGIEHDIMESFEPGVVLPACFHYNGYGADYKGFKSSRVKCDRFGMSCEGEETKLDKTKFHTFGLLWEPDGYTLFVDGVQRGEKLGAGPGEAVSHVPEFILLTTEPKWYRDNRMTGRPVQELEAAVKAGDEFVVDFVRVYDLMNAKQD